MKKLKNSIINKFKNIPLARKLGWSYTIVIFPIAVLLVVSINMQYRENVKYNSIIDIAERASQFSLDFKNDFDYETYLVIVESKSFEESELYSMLDKAEEVVNKLEIESITSSENEKRLKDIAKYLGNLRGYTKQIEDNLNAGDMYDQNLQIWENDVQIVTALVRESIIQFIYYEVQDMKEMHEETNSLYTKVFLYICFTALIITIVVLVISYYISAAISEPIKRLCSVTEHVSRGDLTVKTNIDEGAEIGALATSLDSMIDRINTLLEQVKEEQITLRKTELELLQSQINPHFLYNTLDTIVWLAEAGDKNQVVEMVGSLSDFFRTTLNQGKDIITIKDEIRHVRSYLEIQSVRYKDILEYTIDVSDDILEYNIPKITLQPLVENALYHGIKNKRGKGHITITSERAGGFLQLHVKDNGIGMTEERLKQVRDKLNNNVDDDEVFGLSNINERIRLKFGNRYGIHVDSTYDEGTQVDVMLPMG